MKTSLILIHISIILSTVNAAHTDTVNSVQLQILEPNSLKDMLADTANSIPNELFQESSIIPWGKTITGKLELADPFDACTALVDNTNNNIYENLNRPFVLIQLTSIDNCSIETKIYHAQNYGAIAIIIIGTDDNSQRISENDQKKLSLSSVPVLVVSKTLGMVLQTHMSSKLQQELPTIQAIFPEKKDQHTKYHIDVYLDVDSRETYTLLTALAMFNEEHQKKYDFSMKYKVNGKLQIEEQNDENASDIDKAIKADEVQQRISKSCYFNGEYCNEQNPSAMREIIRQVCVGRYSTDAFFVYAGSVGRQYNEYLKEQIQNIFEVADLNPFDFDAASEIAVNQTNMQKDQLQRCFEGSFIIRDAMKKNDDENERQDSSQEITYLSQNLILDGQLQLWESFKDGDVQLPFVVLNHMEIHPVQGKKYKDQVIATICAAVDSDEDNGNGNKQGSICEGFINQKEDINDDDSLSAGSIVLIVFGGILGSIVVGFVVVKIIQRHIHKRKQEEIYKFVQEYDKVDSILAHPYIELNSDNDKQDNKGKNAE